MRAKPIHTISLLASALALALPASSFALGLGRLTVESSLGQPLSAQIELNSASREELDSIAARIADPSLYRQNNLAYPPILTRARLSVERTQSGQNVLRISTAAPVNEPYLDLLVELNWAAGRVVREYTFLLDPPGMATPAPVIEPVAPVRAGAAAAQRAAATSAPAAAPASRAAGVASGQQYEVRRGDSLARVANQFRPEGVSLEQMLVALFNANPGAFNSNNMNRLRAGSILTVPASDAAAGVAAPEATRIVRMQAADWRGYRDRVADTAPASEGAATRESTGRIGTAVQERTPAAEPGQDQVRVSREAVRGRAGSASAAEDAVARDRAMKDAQTRIAELEKTLQNLQRALEMRNPGMAQLQNRADAGKAGATPAKAGSPAAAAPSVAPATAPPVMATAPKAVEPAASAAKAPETPMKAPEPANPAGGSPKAGDTANAPAATPASTTTTTAAATTAPAAASVATPTPKAAATTPAEKRAAKAPKDEPGFFEELIGNPPTWMLGAGGVVILGAIAALIASRRRKAGHFEDSIISGTDIKSNTVFGSTGGGIVNTGENSLATDFSHEGLTQVDTDEVDPIAEAEVYLAYGRDAQAEEILKDALKKDPQRQEIYLKLLEIHAQHNKPTVFEQIATELYAVSKGQGETWQKAVALGRQLDPNNPMFGAEGGVAPAMPGVVAAAGTAAAGAAAMHFMDNDDPLRRPPDAATGAAVESTPAVPVGVAEIRHEQGLDFRLGDDISITPPAARKTPEPAEAVATATVAAPEPALHDLEFTSHAEPIHAEAAEPASAMTVEERIEAARAADPGYDLDFHLEEARNPAAISAAIGENGARPMPAAPELARPQAVIDLDKLDLSFDPDRAPFDDPTPSVLDEQWHDAATKLDLAKAYQEMGDAEGAREILQEVLNEGDDQQRAEAGALLEKLA